MCLWQMPQKELVPHGGYSSHELAGGLTKLSLNQKLLGSVAPDGKLIVRLTDNMVSVMKCAQTLN